MTNRTKTPVKPVTKPYLTGNITDGNTLKAALIFFGSMVLSAFMSFLVCSMTGGIGSTILRIVINTAVIGLVLLIFFNNGGNRGTEAVTKGEILYQQQERGTAVTDADRAVCFHKMKGFITGLLGVLPFLICAIVLALTAKRQSTGAGALPGWLDIYKRRTEVGDALAAYTAAAPMTLTDILRIIIRIAVMPFVTMVGTENREGMLLLERISPVLFLLPAAAYGIGWMQGPKLRARVHTEIASNNRKRLRKERKARKARMAARVPRGPEKLN